MRYVVYILRNPQNKLYIGHTTNPDRRIKDRLTSRGAKFTKDHVDFKLVHSEEYPTLMDAVKREKQLKGWSRAKKEALVAGDPELLKEL